MSSTPTLFNAGTMHSQLSSCYLTTVADNLEGIYDAIKENALLAKYAGGLGNDWTPVRALRSHIKGTNGESQGVVPFLKVVNDTAVAVNQGGKRKGAVCTYLETLAPGYRRVPGTAQEHRRRTPPHARHEHRQLDSRPVHEARHGSRRMDSVLAVRHPRPARQVGKAFEEAYIGYEAKAASGELQAVQENARADACGARCCRCCSKPATPGSLSRILATSARRSSTSASCTAPTCAPKSRSTPTTPKSPCATWARSTWSRT